MIMVTLCTPEGCKSKMQMLNVNMDGITVISVFIPVEIRRTISDDYENA